MKVVILAGGKGTRLGLATLPKVMVPVVGVPLLERTIRSAVSDGFKDFILLTGYLSESIEQHFGDGSGFGAQIEYIRETEPMGTAGCFRQLSRCLTELFIVLYGDILMRVDLQAFARFAEYKGGDGALFAHPNDHPFDSDLLETDEDGRILAIHPKPHSESERLPNLVSAALYILSPSALDFIPPAGPSDWGKDVFPSLLSAQRIYAYRSCEYAKDIGTRDRLAKAGDHVRQGRLERLALSCKKPAVFLDRDGVINEERNGVHSIADVALIPGSAEAIQTFNRAGVPVICVTNQPDLAKGFMDYRDFRQVTGAIDHELSTQADAYIDDLFVCPHHPEAGWLGEIAELKISCDCRKPAPGLLNRAADFHNLDLGRSWLVGDRYCDIAAAASVGVRSVLVETGHGGSDRALYPVEPDLRATDLREAAKMILREIG